MKHYKKSRKHFDKKIVATKQVIIKTLGFRQTLIETLYNKVQKFQRQHVENIVQQLNNNISYNEATLRKFYGGKQFHLKSAESIKNKKIFSYIDFNNSAYVNKLSVSQPINSTSVLIKSKKNNSQDSDNNQSIKPLLGRYCDKNCQIPDYWATNLFIKLKKLVPSYHLINFQKNFILFETCTECYKLNDCPLRDECKDNIKLLINLSSHYQDLRSLTRRIYEIRQIIIMLIEIDEAFANKNLNAILKITKISIDDNNMPTNGPEPENNFYISYDKAYFEALENDFHKELRKKLIYFECVSCKRLINPDKLIRLSHKHQLSEIALQIINGKNNNAPIDLNACELFICRDQCFEQLFNQKKVPVYSSLNNLEIDFVPEIITSLNFYEKLLIQRAKCFQTIIKLKSYKFKAGKYNIPALKGLAVHLPITFEETHNYLYDELPNVDSLNIIINGLPTKNNNIWRALVDLNKVYLCLQWLKEHNLHYSDIKINMELINEYNKWAKTAEAKKSNKKLAYLTKYKVNYGFY